MGASKQLSNDLETTIIEHYCLGEGNKKAVSEISAVGFHCEEHGEEMEGHRHSSC